MLRVQPPSPKSSQYSQLTTDELLQLAGEATSLRPEAAALLKEELDRRGLSNDDIPAPISEDRNIQRELFSDSSLQFLRSVLFFLGHLAISTLAVGMASAILFYSFKPALTPFLSPFVLRHDLPLMFPFFPIQSIVAVAIGFVLARKKRGFCGHGSAQWVWIVPTLWLLFSFASYQPSSVMMESRWRHFFWSPLLESRRVQLGTTLFFLTSITYALGNFVARRSGDADPS
jgi:hypothetical protein